MGREAFSASILKANLEGLKDTTTEVAEQFKQLSSAAESFGVKFSQNIRSATGDIQALKSSLNSLESSIRRTSGTSSAVGAANVSTALGQLTGQQRGGWGAASGGGGGFPSQGGATGLVGLAGQLAGGTGKLAGGGLGALVGALFRRSGLGAIVGGAAGEKLAKGASAPAQWFGGMMMAGAQQARGERLGWEQAAYLSPLVGREGHRHFRRLERTMGMDAFQGLGMYTGMTSAVGGTRLGVQGRGGTRAFENYVRMSTALKMTPEATMGIGGALKVGGRGAGALEDSYRQMQLVHEESRLRARNLGFKGTEATEEAYRSSHLMMQGLSNFYQQQAAISNINNRTTSRAPGMLGSLSNRFDPAVANSMMGALRNATLAPGGGGAGEIFMMQAGGFGNPYLRQEQATANRLGIDAPIKRRNFFEYQRFKEQDPVGMVLNALVGVETKYGASGTALGDQNQGIKAQVLKTLTKGDISFSRSEELFDMISKGGMSSGALKEKLETWGLGDKDPASRQGWDPKDFTGAQGKELMSQTAKLRGSLLRLGPAIDKFSAAVNAIQEGNLRALGESLPTLTDPLNELALTLKNSDLKSLEVAYKFITDSIAELIKFANKLGGPKKPPKKGP